LLKRRYQKFRRMGEGSAYSQEAMSLEVELLINISAEGGRTGRLVRAQKRKASEEQPAGAPVSPVEQPAEAQASSTVSSTEEA
jgi:hypothetical protein